MDRTDFVDLCKKGDEQALNSLYNTYSGKMMKICLRYVPDRQIAQDLLHDGFIVIFSSIGSLRNPERLESWMGVIMKNTIKVILLTPFLYPKCAKKTNRQTIL